jgi:hypothetical protein
VHVPYKGFRLVEIMLKYQWLRKLLSGLCPNLAAATEVQANRWLAGHADPGQTKSPASSGTAGLKVSISERIIILTQRRI